MRASIALAGDTPILMADGRTKPLSRCCGPATPFTERPGMGPLPPLRASPDVQAHWETRKKAYLVTLEDGTEFVTSGDHRFLTNRGWKHVTGTERGRWRRPHLTLNNQLLGTGAIRRARPPTLPEYRRGYLCGVIRGDGHLASYSYERPGRTHGDVHRVPARARGFGGSAKGPRVSDRPGRRCHRRVCLPSGSAHSNTRMIAIRTQARDNVEAIREADPRGPGRRVPTGGRVSSRASSTPREEPHGGAHPDRQHRPGDHRLDHSTAYGSLASRRVIERTRQSQWTRQSPATGRAPREASLLPSQRTPPSRANARLRGPRSRARRRCELRQSSRWAKHLPLFDITTGTGDFIANGVISHNCFARPTHTYLDFNAREDFEREIVVKVNAPELVRAELARPLLEGRPRRARHQHRSLPVGRGTLPADGGDLGGDAGLRQPLLGADQVAAPVA